MHNLIKVLFVLILPLSVSSQISFYRQFSNDGVDFGEGIVQLEDSSYVICGSSSSFTNGPSEAFLMKLDSMGNYIWSTNYGGFESESARRVMYKKNFGFFIAGFTNSYGAGAYDYYLAKIDESGYLQWEKTFGGTGWDKVNDAVMTADTGVVMVGQTETPNAGQDWYIVKTDSNGDTLWTKTLGGTGDDVANAIEIHNDSMYVIVGNYLKEDSLKYAACYLYLNDYGDIIDSDTVGLSGNWFINDITISNDTVQGVGSYKMNNTDLHDLAFYSSVAQTTTLSTIGGFTGPSIGDQIGDVITVYGDSMERYVGLQTANHSQAYLPGSDIVLAKYRYDLAWLGNFGGFQEYYNDYTGQFIPTSDGGAALVGYRGGVGPGGGTVYIMKIGPGDIYPTTAGVTYVYDIVATKEIQEIQGLNLFPNPVEYSFTVQTPDNSNYSITIVDMLGRKLHESSVFGTSSIDVSSFSSGYYIVNVGADDGRNSSFKICIR